MEAFIRSVVPIVQEEFGMVVELRPLLQLGCKGQIQKYSGANATLAGCSSVPLPDPWEQGSSFYGGDMWWPS